MKQSWKAKELVEAGKMNIENGRCVQIRTRVKSIQRKCAEIFGKFLVISKEMFLLVYTLGSKRRCLMMGDDKSDWLWIGIVGRLEISTYIKSVGNKTKIILIGK